MKSGFFADWPSILILFGGLVAAGGAFWSAFLEGRGKKKSRIVAACFISVGALIGIVGSHWSYIAQAQFEADTLGYITGDDSYSYIIPAETAPGPSLPLTAFIKGKYPQHEVSVVIRDASSFHQQNLASIVSGLASGYVGTLSPQLAHPLPFALPVTNEDAQAFQIDIYANNGHFTEYLDLARASDHSNPNRRFWAISWELYKGTSKITSWKDQEFPPDWKLRPPQN